MTPTLSEWFDSALMVSPLSNFRNVSADFCAPLLPGCAMILVVVLLWLGGSESGLAQYSLGNSAPTVAGAPPEAAWPAVAWGMGTEEQDWRLIRGLPKDDSSRVLSLDSAKGSIILNFRAIEDEGLGAVVNVTSLTTGEGKISRPKESKPEPGQLRLGNVSFNQAADSFNVGKSDTWKPSDISRQFGGTGSIAKNVAPSTPINVWAVVGIAAVTIIVAMAIGFYENDRDDRQRRKKVRRRRHRHSG